MMEDCLRMLIIFIDTMLLLSEVATSSFLWAESFAPQKPALADAPWAILTPEATQHMNEWNEA